MKWYHYLFGHKKRLKEIAELRKALQFQKVHFSKDCTYIISAN